VATEGEVKAISVTFRK